MGHVSVFFCRGCLWTELGSVQIPSSRCSYVVVAVRHKLKVKRLRDDWRSVLMSTLLLQLVLFWIQNQSKPVAQKPHKIVADCPTPQREQQTDALWHASKKALSCHQQPIKMLGYYLILFGDVFWLTYRTRVGLVKLWILHVSSSHRTGMKARAVTVLWLCYIVKVARCHVSEKFAWFWFSRSCQASQWKILVPARRWVRRTSKL